MNDAIVVCLYNMMLLAANKNNYLLKIDQSWLHGFVHIICVQLR